MDVPTTLSAKDCERFWTERSATFAAAARDTRSFYARRTALVAEIVAQHASGPRTLDLGCGTGGLCLDLAQRGFDVHGVDLSGTQIAEAVAALRNVVECPERRFQVGDAAAVPFAETFHVVTAIGVLPYIDDHPAFVAHALSRLAPGGLLLVSCTNRASLFTLAALARHLGIFAPTRDWFAVFMNLLRTGVWSGGFVNPLDNNQCRNARSLDKLCRHLGMATEGALDLYNIDRWGLDRSPLARGRFGRWIARYCGWCHVGTYRCGDNAHGAEA